MGSEHAQYIHPNICPGTWVALHNLMLKCRGMLGGETEACRCQSAHDDYSHTQEVV